MSDLPETPRAWRWRILSLSWPIILSTLSVPLVGIVDTAVVGRLDDPAYLAAVAVGAVIFSSVFWVFGFLRMGTTGFVAQAHGRHDQAGVSLALMRPLAMALVLGVAVILLQPLIGSLALRLMNPGPDILGHAQAYFAIRIWSAPATFINYTLLGCLVGLQQMRQVLFLQLLLNLSNILLDVLLVWGFDAGAEGVALASVLSEYLAAGTGLWLLRKRLHWPDPATLLEPQALRRLLAVNRDLFIRTLFLTGAFFFFTRQGAQLGTEVVAANAVLLNMLHMISYGLDGFAHAVEALVGSAWGARNRRAFVQAIRAGTEWALLVAVGISGLYALFGEAIIGLMTTLPGVLELAGQYRGWLVLAPLAAVWSYLLDGVYIGATQTRLMRNTVGWALLVYMAASWVLVPLGGNHALWGALLLFLLLRGVGLAVYFPGLVRELG
ncbi:MAG: MATE family efflux transporter [Thiolinea sp.]